MHALNNMAGHRSSGSRSAPVVPVDIVFVALALVSCFLALQLPAGFMLRTVVVLGTLLTVPGYVLTTAAFPGYTNSPTTPSVVRKRGRGRVQFAALTDMERAALSLGLSLLLLPLFALVLAFFGRPIGASHVFFIVAVFVGVIGVVGVVRRARLPASSRYDIPVLEWAGAAREGLAGGGPTDTALNIALAGSILLASTMLVGAVVAPSEGYRYTDTALVTINDQGQYVEGNYPTEFVKDQPRKITLVVDNHEGTKVEYTVVVQLQRVDEKGQVTNAQELNRYSRIVPNQGEWQLRHSVAPTMTGDRLRMTWLIYKGGAPANPTIQNADDHLYLWVEVVE